jgi:hypothetical protein
MTNIRIIIRLKLKLKLICDRQSVGQSVLVSGAHLGPVTNFSFSLKFPSDNCVFVILLAPSLTRRRVCNLLVQLLLVLARAVTLGPKSRRTHDHILLSHLRLLQPGGSGSRIYIPQEQSGPVIPPGTGFPFCRLLRLAGQWWRYSNPPPHGTVSWLELQWSWSSSCGRQSVDQFIWVSGLPLGPLTRFYLALLSSSDNYFTFFFRRRPLWRENGSVVYSAITR